MSPYPSFQLSVSSFCYSPPLSRLCFNISLSLKLFLDSQLSQITRQPLRSQNHFPQLNSQEPPVPEGSEHWVSFPPATTGFPVFSFQECPGATVTLRPTLEDQEVPWGEAGPHRQLCLLPALSLVEAELAGARHFPGS